MNEPKKEEFPPKAEKALLWGTLAWILIGIIIASIALAVGKWGSNTVTVLILCILAVVAVVAFLRKRSESFLNNYDKEG